MTARAKVLRWPYRPHLAGTAPGTVIEHSGGSALAWVRIVVDGEALTSADPGLIACQRLVLEQREQESA